MPSLRIAILFEYPSLNGGERSMLAVIDQLKSANSQFEFVALAPPTGPLAVQLAGRDIEVLPLEQHQPNGVRKTPDALRTELSSLVEQVQPSILHANSLAMSRLTGSLAPDLPCRCSGHLRDIMRISKAAMADLNRNDRLAAVSRATRDHHVHGGMDPQRVDVVYNGVDPSAFQPRPASSLLTKEFNLPPGAFVILSVGQIGLRKGLEVLVEAAVDVCQRIGDIQFAIVGERHSTKSESIEFEVGLQQRISQAGFVSRWHRLGQRDDVAQLMNSADLLVHAAHQEPLGRVLLEAAASGLPIVATDVGGTSEILKHDSSALLIKSGDAAALASAIVELYHDESRRTALSENARQTVEERFTVQHAAQCLSRFWLAILQG